MTSTAYDDSRFRFNTLQYVSESQMPNRDVSWSSLDELVAPHIDSFDEALDSGSGLLDAVVSFLEPREVHDASGNVLRFWIENVAIDRPMLPDGKVLLPKECRERNITYRSRMRCTLVMSVNDGPPVMSEKSLGGLPLMVRSRRCHLFGRSPCDLVAAGEDAEEAGGYFIVNGIERIIRLLIVARRNHPMALERSSLAKRGPLYTPFGVQIRCVRPDETSQTIYLHYQQSGAVIVRVHVRKAEYLIPLALLLRAMAEPTDREIMETILQGDEDNTFAMSRLEGLLRDFSTSGLMTRVACLQYLGERMATVLPMTAVEGESELDLHARRGEEFIKRFILVHLDSSVDKMQMLLFMVRKLYATVAGTALVDNPDSPANQEVLLPGQLYLSYLKEKLDDWLSGMRAQLANEVRQSSTASLVNWSTPMGMQLAEKAMSRVSADVGRKLEYFLASGNIASHSGLDLQQTSGFSVVAERLNYMRFLSHFRSIHRGAFFAELKTTAVRKLQPEAWGFLCPVHTPDGSPCGLLNHLARACLITATAIEKSVLEHRVVSLLLTLGCVPVERYSRRAPDTFPVILDGKWIANVRSTAIMQVARELRRMKHVLVDDMQSFLKPGGSVQYCKSNPLAMMEVCGVPTSHNGLFPGLYLFGGATRMMRPVYPLVSGMSANDLASTKNRVVMLMGIMEQTQLEVAVSAAEVRPHVSEYYEIDIANMMSVVANLTPFPDHNQSPRNMYQCQMGKQSMATPLHNYCRRTDNKLYRLLTPQTPIVRTNSYNRYRMDNFPAGTNAVVAVISYTGYDMEDAMIINKSAHDRGFGHGCIYKTEIFDIAEKDVRGEGRTHFFGVANPTASGGEITGQSNLQSGNTKASGPILHKTIDIDGLPSVGQRVEPDDVLFSIIDEATGRVTVQRFKGMEGGFVEEVRLLGEDGASSSKSARGFSRISIKFRIPRNPIIGDKFSSRHGQKGVCSQLYPLVDMPFTESGMTPDVIINPHAFPSRMTIGMFVESIAAKAGALHGLAQDGTPFGAFGEKHTAASYFGEQLVAAGYNYAGNEPMYSGIHGCEMRADIYIGVVYYQRLRHMVSDKFQVRTTGPVHNLTQQPVKGRKRAGGIRFGEMERDSLLAHGVSSLLKDRLMNCSDYSQSYACRRCGSVLSPVASVSLTPADRSMISSSSNSMMPMMHQQPKTTCHVCGKGDQIVVVAIPFVFRYLLAELMAMNIELCLQIN